MINKKLLDLEKIINVKFNNRDLLRRSLIHKSYNNETNNEKLEFLGDRVLGLVLSKALILIYTNEKEGVIDKKFSNLVNKNVEDKNNLEFSGTEYAGLVNILNDFLT